MLHTRKRGLETRLKPMAMGVQTRVLNTSLKTESPQTVNLHIRAIFSWLIDGNSGQNNKSNHLKVLEIKDKQEDLKDSYTRKKGQTMGRVLGVFCLRAGSCLCFV